MKRTRGRLLTSLSCQSPESKSGSGQVTCSSGDRQAPTQGLQATASLPGATHPLQTEAVQRLQTLQPRLGAGGAGRGHPSHLASSAAQLPARLFWCYNSSYPLRVMSVDQPIGLLVCPALRLEEQRCAQVPSNHQFILKRAVEPRPEDNRKGHKVWKGDAPPPTPALRLQFLSRCSLRH